MMYARTQAEHIALTERNTGLRIYVLDNSGSTAAMDGKTYVFDTHSNNVTKCSCTRYVNSQLLCVLRLPWLAHGTPLLQSV